MKLELDLWRRLLDVTKFLNRYLKTYIKKHGKLLKIQNAKNKREKGTYVEKYTAGHLCTKFDRLILIYEVMIAKKKMSLIYFGL